MSDCLMCYLKGSLKERRTDYALYGLYECAYTQIYIFYQNGATQIAGHVSLHGVGDKDVNWHLDTAISASS